MYDRLSTGRELDGQSVYIEAFVRESQKVSPVLEYEHDYEYE